MMSTKTRLKISAKQRTAVGKQASVLRRTGVIPAVLYGKKIKNFTEVEVECLPADLPHDLEVDISGLNTFADFVKVSDIKIDLQKVKLHISLDEVVIKVAEPRTEEELKALEEKPEGDDVTAVEGVVKEEKSDEAGAEGKSEEKAEKKEGDKKNEEPEKKK